MGKGYAKESGQDCFYVPLPGRLKDVQIRELRFIPTNGQWVIEYVHESMETPALSCPLYPGRVLALDPGVNNLLTGATNTGQAFIMDGRSIKAENQGWNRLVSGLRSILTKGRESTKGVTSKRIQSLTHNRNNFMRDAINKAARWVIDFCKQNQIDAIVYGRNKRQKDSINIGGKNNQEFVQIPHYKLFDRIQQLCLIHGIRLIETEESYTSQASFFDNDLLPTFGEKPEGWKASGKRVKRGLYRTVEGFVNADCNGAANIMRKVSTKLGIDLSGVCRGAVAAPFKVKLTSAGFSLT